MMFSRPAMKPAADKVRRRGHNHFTAVIIPVNRVAELGAKFDALGGVLVVSASVTLVLLMRLVIAN